MNSYSQKFRWQKLLYLICIINLHQNFRKNQKAYMPWNIRRLTVGDGGSCTGYFFIALFLFGFALLHTSLQLIDCVRVAPSGLETPPELKRGVRPLIKRCPAHLVVL